MSLSVLIFLPLVYALIVWMMPNDRAVRYSSLGFSIFHLGYTLAFLGGFDSATASLQFVERVMWVKGAGIEYFLGMDGISLWLIVLSNFLVPLIVLGSWTSIEKKVGGFHVSLFLLQSTMLGTFLAMDAILFYTFFEASLIPMYFMVGIWGGENRIYASMKFFIYTMFGSLFMLLSIIALMFMTEDQLGAMSSNLLQFYKLQIPFVAGEFLSTQTLLFFGFAIAFAIKVPLFPFHTWLPDAHVQAPTPGSVILAGVMLKMGTYGFMRISLPLFPEATQYWGWVFLVLAVIGIIYGALVAMVQPDMKKLVAYSSVSHMGFVVMGLFAMNAEGLTGGLYQMLNHGVSTGALFLLVGMIYERTHSRKIEDYGGLAPAAPIFTIFFIIVTMSSIAVPMTNGFVGEFLIMLGTFLAYKPFVIFAVLGVVLAATYMLWMVKRVFFGPAGKIVTEWKDKNLDINPREIAVLTPLTILIFWMGIFPNHFLDFSKTSIDHLVKNKSQYFLTIEDAGKAPKGTYSQIGN
ncbi:MAG: Fe-S-binding domain-containing protein [Bdellovibrionaceae bacterium]|nr:Fe-S-binding domain-containing protein [Pseudobdellovibrionaceae bacterium]|tara:strand:+ start:157797 stop:159353 length:1557 start_codon:yes stop_codon:yes gene_type:complete